MSWTDDVDALVRQAVAEGRVPGAVAVIAGPEGLRHESAAGDTTPDTIFRFASMTKAVTTVAALQLIEQGRLSLDTHVAEVVPAFGTLQVLDGFDGDEPRLRPPATPVTIKHLLTHTSGLGYFFTSPELIRFHEATGTPNVLTGLLASLYTPLLFDPGARWEYGISTDWLGQVVEMVAGQDLEACFAEGVFAPLGMTETTFRPSAEQRARCIPIHHRLPDGGLVPGELDLPADPEFLGGGSGLYGTARDYARLLSALLDGGGPVLRPETAELMFTDALDGAPLPAEIPSAVPELMNDLPAFPWAEGWGLGLHLALEDLPGMRRAGSGDWAGLFNSYFWADPKAGVAGAFFTQVLPFFDAQIVETTLALEQAVYAGVGAAV